MGMKLKTDDNVIVISGKDKGKTGKVIRVEPSKDRVYVEGVNVQKRHVKPATLQDTEIAAPQTGGIIESEGTIHVSNVMLIDPKSGDPTRVGIRREDGKRVRFAKKSGEVID